MCDLLHPKEALLVMQTHDLGNLDPLRADSETGATAGTLARIHLMGQLGPLKKPRKLLIVHTFDSRDVCHQFLCIGHAHYSSSDVRVHSRIPHGPTHHSTTCYRVARESQPGGSIPKFA